MLGLCCQYIEPKIKRNGSIEYINLLNEKTLQFKAFQSNKYTDKQILDTYVNNLTNLQIILKRILSEGIRCFRVSSGLLPLFDVVRQEISHDKIVLALLKNIGDFVLSNKMRISTHPDQFCVLSSDNQNVITNSIKILQYHAWIFDQMAIPESAFYSINIHGGKRGASDRLIESIKSLPNNVRARLTLENDESSYAVTELLSVSNKTGVPICFDSHHHTFRDGGLSGEEACLQAMETWGDVKPMTHLSNTTPGLENGSFKDKRKHSDYIHYFPEYQRRLHEQGKIDIEVEAKAKNLAIFKMIKDFCINE